MFKRAIADLVERQDRLDENMTHRRHNSQLKMLDSEKTAKLVDITRAEIDEAALLKSVLVAVQQVVLEHGSCHSVDNLIDKAKYLQKKIDWVDKLREEEEQLSQQWAELRKQGP